MPDGVFNVAVHGDKVAVDAILEHPGVAAVSFVGSTPIARYIYETGTKRKRVQGWAAPRTTWWSCPMRTSAWPPTPPSRPPTGRPVSAAWRSALSWRWDAGDPLVHAIEERLPKIKVGPGSDPESEMGPLITREHRDKVASFLDSGREQGATLRVDGRDHHLHKDGEGFFLGVSLLDHVTPEMDCYRNEIFGPVLEIVRVPTYADAMQVIEDNPYANGTAIYTRDGRRHGSSSSMSTWAWSA